MRARSLPYDVRYQGARYAPTNFVASFHSRARGIRGSQARPMGHDRGHPVSSAEQARLTAAERDAGWKLLFDGTTTKGWRGFKKTGFPAKGWSIDAGRLKHAASGGSPTAESGDIITIDTFNDFDLRFEWIVAPGANSGIKYLVTEERDGPIAHEYQVIDDAKHPDALIGPHRATAALYDVIAAPASKILKPAGAAQLGPHPRAGQPRRALAQRRKGDRVRAGQRGAQGREGEKQVQGRPRLGREDSKATSCCRIMATKSGIRTSGSASSAPAPTLRR